MMNDQNKDLKGLGDVPGFVDLKKGNFPPLEISQCLFNKSESHCEKVENLEGIKSPFKQSSLTLVKGFGDSTFFHGLQERFGIHRLFIEDILTDDHPVKIEIDKDKVYFVLRPSFSTYEESKVSLSLVLGEDGVLVFCPSGETFHIEKVLERIRRDKGVIRSKGHDYIIFSIVDVVLDSYFPRVDEITKRIRKLDNLLFEGSDNDLLKEIKEIRKILTAYYTNLLPLEDLIRRFVNNDEIPIDPSNKRYFNDANDQVRILCSEILRAKEATSDIINLSTALNGAKMNEVMKVLTIISTVFIPLSFIVGLYGMNFNTEKSFYNMPELNWEYGYIFVLSLMIIIVSVMFAYFRRKKWL